ncbi:hypothetical protein J437_LFUL007148 [Ladona fulva]|uniref:Uncharacterized protein n=1 Tax=Ladona fulva TaxID=123851 RepID=A0A8K0NYQ1_LADFU|nr:hypothetical protein J437_LFUL007148 [Ladona fulva]
MAAIVSSSKITSSKLSGSTNSSSSMVKSFGDETWYYVYNQASSSPWFGSQLSHCSPKIQNKEPYVAILTWLHEAVRQKIPDLKSQIPKVVGASSQQRTRPQITHHPVSGQTRHLHPSTTSILSRSHPLRLLSLPPTQESSDWATLHKLGGHASCCDEGSKDMSTQVAVNPWEEIWKSVPEHSTWAACRTHLLKHSPILLNPQNFLPSLALLQYSELDSNLPSQQPNAADPMT